MSSNGKIVEVNKQLVGSQTSLIYLFKMLTSRYMSMCMYVGIYIVNIYVYIYIQKLKNYFYLNC